MSRCDGSASEVFFREMFVRGATRLRQGRGRAGREGKGAEREEPEARAHEERCGLGVKRSRQGGGSAARFVTRRYTRSPHH